MDNTWTINKIFPLIYNVHVLSKNFKFSNRSVIIALVDSIIIENIHFIIIELYYDWSWIKMFS